MKIPHRLHLPHHFDLHVTSGEGLSRTDFMAAIEQHLTGSKNRDVLVEIE